MTAMVKNLYGLILAGGHSKRMGQDKALLKYHGRPQVVYAYDLLKPFCERVFLSVRPDQSQKSPYNEFAQLGDDEQFKNIGPLGGILSAMKAYPQTSWLVLACDLPFVTAETVRYLISQRNPGKPATAFMSVHDGLPEPLCAIWEPAAQVPALEYFRQGIQCPRKILIKSDPHLIQQADPRWLDNVNTSQEYNQVRQQ